MTFLDGVADVLSRTKAEIPVLAVAGTILFGAGAAWLSSWNEYSYPLQFSERTQIEQDAKLRGEKPSAATIYHADALDIAMKTFEANNKGAVFPSKKDYHFAKALKAKYNDPSHHFTLAQLTSGFDSNVIALKEEMDFQLKARDLFSSAYVQIKNAWRHDADDEYILVPVVVTSTDADGNVSTGIELQSQYDHTDHTYNFDRNQASVGLNSLKGFFSVPRPRNFNLTLSQPSVINEPNLKAIIESRKQADPKRDISEGVARNIGKGWGRSANIPRLVDSAYGGFLSTEKQIGMFQGVVESAPQHVVKTTSSSTDYNPPAGFNFYESYADCIGGVVNSLNKAEETIDNSNGIVNQIRRDLEKLAKSNDIGSEEIKLAKSVRNSAEKLVAQNFSRGIEVPKKRWYVPVLWGIAGLAIGALAGLGLDAWADKRSGNNYVNGSNRWRY